MPAAVPTPRPSSGSHPQPPPALHFHDVQSADGTRLRAWDNGVAGPTVLLCNGLGANPYAWPALLDPDCGVRVVSWQHRGTGGSQRPPDRDHAGIDAFVEDALAVLDDAGIDRAPVMGWSMGVNTAFELAQHHPERVSGLFAVAGVPGHTFGSMLGPLRMPRILNEAVAVGISRVLKHTGPALTPVTSRLPIGPRAVALVSHSGFMLPVADAEMVGRAMRDFLTTPVDWYFHMALRTHQHQRVPLSRIGAPAAFLAGRWDVLAGTRDMRTAAERMPGATYAELPGTHFLPLERPAEVHAHLLDFLSRLD
jgi:pimeloyl-ACP methyl ester carboxylesterase